MNNLFEDFKKVTKEEWINKISHDLKGKDLSILEVNDELEEINYSSFYHAEDAVYNNAVPGNFPFLRGMNDSSNAWKNGVLVEISNETTANNKALSALNTGADLIVFKSLKETTDWKKVINGLQFEYIETQFVVRSQKEFDELIEIVPANNSNIHFNIDFLENQLFDKNLASIASHFKKNQSRFCSVESFKIQQSGATTWQEIGFCLSASHDYLVQLMELGFTIDEASACIGFKIGIGSNYFLEIAKIRALKLLWSKIVKEYSPKHECSYNCHITAVIGHMNKSLADPYTNLLRQTTEAMSAVNGGVQSLVILPFDHYSTEGSTALAERLALNISSILGEESYSDRVIDPFGGSYSIENLTKIIGEKSWDYFKTLDELGGIFTKASLEELTKGVNAKRKYRIAEFLAKNTIAIGINKYESISPNNFEWKVLPDYLGIKTIVLELEFQKAIV